MQLDPTTDESFRQFLPGQATEDEKMLIADFYVGKKLMGFKSEKEGRPVFEDREYVRIMIKGQDKQIVVEEVSNKHKQRFPNAYAAFLHNKPAPVIGTPIEMLPGIGPSMAHNLKGMNLRSIEDLAAVTDENTFSRIGMGARELVRTAKQWLEKSDARSTELSIEKERLERENAVLRAQVAAKAKRESKRKKADSPESRPEA